MKLSNLLIPEVKAHERVTLAGNDFQHKLSRQLIDENQAVVVEALKVKKMLKNHCFIPPR